MLSLRIFSIFCSIFPFSFLFLIMTPVAGLHGREYTHGEIQRFKILYIERTKQTICTKYYYIREKCSSNPSVPSQL
jgi:hypothetical protein